MQIAKPLISVVPVIVAVIRLTENYRIGAFYSGRYLRKVSFMQFSRYSKTFSVSLKTPTTAATIANVTPGDPLLPLPLMH